MLDPNKHGVFETNVFETKLFKMKKSRRRFVNGVFDAMLHCSIGLLLLMVMDSKVWGVVGVLSSSMLKRITMWCMDWIDDGVDEIKPWPGTMYTEEEKKLWNDYLEKHNENKVFLNDGDDFVQ